jgi:hypothetical protein
MSGDNLGPVGPWQIRDFPKKLSKRVAVLALDAKRPVAELVTAALLAYLDGDRGTNGHAYPAAESLTPAELRDVMQAALHAADAAQQPMPKRQGARLYRLHDNVVRVLIGAPARKPRVAPQLPARKPANRIDSSVRDSGS